MYMIKITQEVKEEMVLSTIKDDYTLICKDIASLKNRTDLPPHLHEDLIQDCVLKKAMEILLKYYMPVAEAEDYIKKTLDECKLLQYNKYYAKVVET